MKHQLINAVTSFVLAPLAVLTVLVLLVTVAAFALIVRVIWALT
jgi:hypothetical protein